MSVASGVSEQKKASSGDPPRFQWDDPLLLDDALTEDERMVRDTARAYCQDKLMPRVLEANRHERFDREIIPMLLEAGVDDSEIEALVVDNPRRFFTGDLLPVG